MKTKVVRIIQHLSTNQRLFLLIIVMTFTIFIFTTNAHRYAIDDDIAQQLTIHLITQQPDPDFVAGESKMEFNYANMRPWVGGPPCQNGILCYPATIGHSITELPFVFVNHYLHLITHNTVIWTDKDFDDPHYVWWRNSLDPDFTFLQLFYGPLISALSVGIFFLICRILDFNQKNSIVLTLFYGFATTVWAYSKVSLSNIPEALFILLSFLMFKKFQKNRSTLNVLLCASSLGFAFLIRFDASLFILVLSLFFLFEISKQDKKIKKIISFAFPLALSYTITLMIDFLRYGPVNWVASNTLAGTAKNALTTHLESTITGSFGLLLSPGVGLLIFAPILLTIFFSFPDFYKKNKHDCVFFLCTIGLSVLAFGSVSPSWHGLIAWGARYLLPIIPFFLLPLGASLEKRKNKTLKVSLITLAGLGVFFNLMYMVQDVSWFVWTYPGSPNGLFGIALPSDPLYISPKVLWTFEYSQLTQSIIMAFTHLQPDIFLLKLLGPVTFGFTFVAILSSLIFLLVSVMKEKSNIDLNKSESNNIQT